MGPNFLMILPDVIGTWPDPNLFEEGQVQKYSFSGYNSYLLFKFSYIVNILPSELIFLWNPDQCLNLLFNWASHIRKTRNVTPMPIIHDEMNLSLSVYPLRVTSFLISLFQKQNVRLSLFFWLSSIPKQLLSMSYIIWFLPICSMVIIILLVTSVLRKVPDTKV